jgi:FtsP/CotA-like multicopper oxidase with cupredoxin domain
MKPISTVARGCTCVLTLKNNTSWWHPMHLHGFSFRVLTRNGIPVRRTRHDTLLVEPNETADLAFVADNPSDGMLHCHVTDHQESGMMAVIRVS